ncbi:MAG TPA: EAL domain-containing protein, partial [Allocoleopsis sp.]
SFVSSMDVSEDSLEIVRTIHALAHNLGMDVTAEGVETADQAEKLRLMDCEYGQGYFFSQPLDASVVSSLLVQQQDRGRGITHHERQKGNGE